ncbi:NAD-dependent epimerase/dehydratase family protein [Streptomyces sp. NPDC003032]
MEIIGRGFLAGNLAPLAGRHPGVCVLAAGVSATGDTSLAEYGREAERLYELMERCADDGRKLVFLSTASAGMYALRGGPGREDGPVRPGTAYGRHKLGLEAVLRASGLEWLILRLAHVVGPGEPPHLLLPALTSQIVSGTVRVLRGASRDLIDVTDVVQVIDELLERGVNHEVVNVASGHAVPVEEIITCIEQRLGTRAVRDYVPARAGQPVSTEKLRALVPAVAGMGFGPGYFRGVLDNYLDACVPELTAR